MSIAQAIEVLKIEAEGILNLVDHLDENFTRMVDQIYNSIGRVIVSGIGKSGIIGRKLVATLNSTGTRALFLHPVEAMHGDLGMVCRDDIFIALSYSGETDELNILVPSIRNIGCKVIAFTGDLASTLAQHSDLIIDISVKQEACPMGLAPTASSTAQLAMSDALAVVLLNKRHFKADDFRKFHPGGVLGHRLASQVQDIMLTGNSMPSVLRGVSLTEAIAEIDRLELGAVLILNEDGTLSGIITDGDIRRLVAKGQLSGSERVDTVMTAAPRTVRADSPAYDALNLMEKYQITILPIVDEHQMVKGILHLHDILGKGEFKFNEHNIHRQGC